MLWNIQRISWKSYLQIYENKMHEGNIKVNEPKNNTFIYRDSYKIKI